MLLPCARLFLVGPPSDVEQGLFRGDLCCDNGVGRGSGLYAGPER